MHTLKPTRDEFEELSVAVLAKGGCFRFRAFGQSMWPFIRNGTVLTVAPAVSENLRVGEAVLYRSGNHLAVHRIARIQISQGQRVFRIRADSWPFDWELIHETHVLARVTGAERAGKPCWLGTSCPSFVILFLSALRATASRMGLGRMLSTVSCLSHRLAQKMLSGGAS
jgi:hypothetical protein